MDAHGVRHARACVALAVYASFSVPADRVWADDAGSCSPEQIDVLIDRLGDTSFKTRTQATQDLINCGPGAFDALKRAAESADLETRVRAKALCAVFEELLFAGADISLRTSRSAVAWDEPFDLTVSIRNPTTHPINVPFILPLQDAGGDQAHLTQCTRMMDIADFLVVTDGAGDVVDLKVDDINQDARVRDAVMQRAEDAPIGRLDSARSVDFTIPEFNRGWARYPLLKKGPYTIRLLYQPDWNHDELNEGKVGMVQSDAVTMTVTQSAPEPVRTSHGPARLVLRREGDRIVAALQNRDDLPLYVNNYFASDKSPPAARLQWVLVTPTKGKLLPIERPGGSGEGEFSRDLLVKLAPAELLDLQSVPLAAILGLDPPGLHPTGLDPPGAAGPRLQVWARYTNLIDAAWQREHASQMINNPQAPEALRTQLPLRLLLTTLDSEILTIQESE